MDRVATQGDHRDRAHALHLLDEIEHQLARDIERLDQYGLAGLEPERVVNDDLGQSGVARVAHGTPPGWQRGERCAGSRVNAARA